MWRSPFRAPAAPVGPADGAPVALFVDTFTTYFEPENARAALRLLAAAGRRVTVLQAVDGGRPLCCGRTFLAAGQVDQAREEMQRTLAAVAGLDEGTPVLGLEPSCLFTFRDELAAVLPGAEADALAGRAKLITEYLAEADDLDLPLKPLPQAKALLHGHCHEKAFAAADAAAQALRLIPGLDVQPIASSCCGMAGNFGYQAETYDASQRMAELSLLPAVRDADADTLIAADGTSCRHQIHDGTGREALHVVRLLDAALDIRAH
jgi:Fe-S oxidoreductase